MLKFYLRVSFFISALFILCGYATDTGALISVQPNIKNVPIFRKLDKQKEPEDAVVLDTSKMQLRTTYVFYNSNKNHPLNDTTFARNNRSKLYIDSHGLEINIGENSPFGGDGFKITCKNGKFNIQPYQWSDIIVIGKSKPSFKVIKQSLTLNTNKYFLGDSIYGKVDFKIIENKKITHIGYGYFRAKIKKL